MSEDYRLFGYYDDDDDEVPYSKKEKSEEELLDEKMMTYLSPKQYMAWLSGRSTPWGKAVASIPFGEYRKPQVSLDDISEKFDENIFGRDEEKEEMLRKAATFIVKGKFRRPLLFVGSPGEGKSCFAKSLASALGYPIKYINMPSINSILALCGSERHYENTRVGVFLETVMEEQTLSVVFVFDEIDKLSAVYGESIEASLLALFDPMWNGMFVDRSLGVPVDLSRCIFICTANDLSKISAPMQDRMDIICFDSYTSEQAAAIMENMTIPRLIANSGMKDRIKFEENVARAIVAAKENGSMRDYEKIAEKLVDNAVYNLLRRRRFKYTVTTEDLERVIPKKERMRMGFSV